MESPRFINHYRPLFVWLRMCGLPTLWLKKPSLIFRLLLIFYDTVIVVMVSYTLCCYIYTIMITSIAFQDLCLLGIVAVCYICGLLVTIYHIRFRERLKLITDRMDSIIETIFQSELGGAEFLQQLYQKNSKLMAILTNNSLLFSFTTPFFYFWSVPVMDWLAGIYRTNSPLPLVGPYDGKAPVVYELMVLLISCSIGFSTSKKSATDCLFISLFKIQINFIKYLSALKNSLNEEFAKGDNVLIRQKLMMWVRMHQEIIRSIRELIEIFSPVVIIYSVSVVNIVVCGAFVLIKKDNDNLIQSTSIGSYVFITVLYYYLLSNTAGELTIEVQKLTVTAYSLPWYEMNKNNSDLIRMVIMNCNKPIQVTAYKASMFILNRETFTGFMVSAISAFVTFCQIKDRYE